MDPSLPLVKVIILLACCAFFSASETALFSLTKFQLRQIKNKSAATFERIRFLLDRPAALVTTILIGSEFATVIISHLMANYYDQRLQSSTYAALLNIFTVIPLILLFGEITPKILAAKTNIKTAIFVIPFVWIFYKAILPLRWFFELFVNIFLFRGKKKNENSESIKEEDFLTLLEEGKNKGAIHASEQDIIENIFGIDDDNVFELSTPLRDFFTISEDADLQLVMHELKNKTAARVPVWSKEPTNIVGILYAKDLLNFINRESKGVKVKHLMKSPLFVQPTMKAEALFKRFRQLKVHIAIIEDKNGKGAAVITMENILDQMFGELWDNS